MVEPGLVSSEIGSAESPFLTPDELIFIRCGIGNTEAATLDIPSA